MKHTKLFCWMLVAGMGAAGTAMMAQGFRKERNLQRSLNLDNVKARSFVPGRKAAPSQTAPNFTNRASEQEAPTLRGLVVGSDPYYICEFKGEPGSAVRNIHTGYDMPEATGSAFYADGKFYVMTFCQEFIGEYSTMMTIYDANTWEELEVREDLLPSSTAYCLTYDPQTDAAYGYFQNDDLDSTWALFGRLNLATGEVTELNSVDIEECFVAMASGTDGYLYGITRSGVYCRITHRGEITKLGHTDVKPEYVQSATIDPATGKFYWAAFTDEGKGELYTIDPVTYMAQLVEEFPGNQEILGLYVVDNTTSAEMPGIVSDLSVVFTRDTYQGQVKFLAPAIYGNGEEITEPLTAHVAIDGNHYESPVQPGREVTFDVTVHYEGLYNATAWVSTPRAAGNKSYVQKWAGPDQPAAVSNLEVTVEGVKATVSWEAPSEGIHGGWLDPSALTYIVSRQGYGYHFERDYPQTTYVDDLGEGVSADVRYMVRAVNGFYGGAIEYSDWVHVGADVLEVPFSISPNSDYNKFIVIDANEDGTTWESSFMGYAVLNGGYSATDDWMITPEIHLEAGTVYQLEYCFSAKMGVLSPETLEICIGKGGTVADMTQQIDYQTLRTTGITNFTTFNPAFSVSESGNYRLGLHAISDRCNQLGLSSLSLSTLASSAGPQASTALRVIPAEQGGLEATVEFTLPSKDSDGNDLESISKVELYNGDRLADRSENLEPGVVCVLKDENANQGNNEYSIIAYGSDGTKGLEAAVSGWIGLDIPQLPSNLEIEEVAEGVRLVWSIPETGLHGGYVNPDEIRYTIIEPFMGSPIGEVIGGNETIVNFGELESQTGLALGLMVQNQAGLNRDYVMSPTIIVGPAYQLPMHERFARNTDYSWTTAGGDDDDLVGWAPEESVGFDGLTGCTTYYGEYVSDSQSLVSGKIEIPEGGVPTMRMWVKLRAGREPGGVFNVKISENSRSDYTVIYSETVTKATDSEWHTLEIPLANYAGKTVYLAFEGMPDNEGNLFIGIDDLKIGEALDHDALITNIALSTEEVEVGRATSTITVWIGNQGKQVIPAGDYTVDFYAGERRFASLEGTQLNPLFGYAQVSAEYEPTTDDSATSEITVKVNYDADQDFSNNISEGKDVYVTIPALPSATDLTAKVDDANGVELEWNAADQSGLPIRMVTDDFESYRTWAQNYVGDWTIIDEDQCIGTKTSYFFPGSAGAIGWMVMEPRQIPTGYNGETHADRQPAYSGEKYMIAFNPNWGTDNKDWLITPELSGNAHEVSFMARAESFNAGREMFEVYYSTAGNRIEDMVRLDDVSYRTELQGWSQFRFNVPEGAKYFAVRCVSHNRFAMHIDDFTYESGPTPVEGSLVGYNIYCNGERLNDEPTAATTFRHAAPAEGLNSYYVRAVYDRGEAPASNEVVVVTTGIEMVGINPEVEDVYDVRGLRVSHLEEGEVYVSKGRRFVYRRK